MGLNTTPATWTTSQVVTAANLNTEVRDALTGIQAAWVAFTPTVTGFVVGNGTISGRYRQIGKTVEYTIDFTAGTTSTYSGIMTVTLPVAQHSRYAAGYIMGSGLASANGALPWAPVNCDNSAGSTAVRLLNGSTGAASGTTSPVTWGTTSQFHIEGIYEAA